MSTIPSTPSIAALILAAGKGKRFGSDKRLATLNHSPNSLLQQSLNLPLSLQIPTAVVLRPEDQQQLAKLLGAHLSNPLLSPIYSSKSEQGMAYSLAAGIHQLLTQNYDGVLILLGDMPWIKPSTLNELIQHYQPGKIIVPTYQSSSEKVRSGHPVFFTRYWFKQLEKLEGDEGAKKLLNANTQDIILVDVNDRGILRDVDQPNDLTSE